MRHQIRAGEVDRDDTSGRDVRPGEERGGDYVLRCTVLLALIPQVDAQAQPTRGAKQQLVRDEVAGSGEDALATDEDAGLEGAGVPAGQRQMPQTWRRR